MSDAPRSNGRRPVLVVNLVTPEKTSPSRRRRAAVTSQLPSPHQRLQQTSPRLLKLQQEKRRLQQDLNFLIEKSRNKRINGPSARTVPTIVVKKELIPQQPKPKPKQPPPQQQPTTSSDGGGGRIALCPICFECVFKEKAASTDCGHLFCHRCIVQEMEIRPRCPMCSRQLTTKSQIIPIYGHH